MRAVIEPGLKRFGWECLNEDCHIPNRTQEFIQYPDFDFIDAGVPEELLIPFWDRMKWRAKRLGFPSDYGVTEDYRHWKCIYITQWGSDDDPGTTELKMIDEAKDNMVIYSGPSGMQHREYWILVSETEKEEIFGREAKK